MTEGPDRLCKVKRVLVQRCFLFRQLEFPWGRQISAKCTTLVSANSVAFLSNLHEAQNFLTFSHRIFFALSLPSSAVFHWMKWKDASWYRYYHNFWFQGRRALQAASDLLPFSHSRHCTFWRAVQAFFFAVRVLLSLGWHPEKPSHLFSEALFPSMAETPTMKKTTYENSATLMRITVVASTAATAGVARTERTNNFLSRKER